MYSKYCSQFPEHSHDKTDLNPFFYRNLSKPIPQGFLAVEAAVTNLFYSILKYSQEDKLTCIYYKNLS